jgi:phosphoglycolate phosphatase-like HAD superfamily hydrolase
MPPPCPLPARRLGLLAGVTVALAMVVPGHAAEPLPSWRDGTTRNRILNFVTAVTTPGSPAYVTPAARLAVFDDDGTLWPEKPRAAGLFALPELRRKAGSRPEWRIEMPFRGALELGGKYLTEATDADVADLVAHAFAGSTQDDFRQQAREFWQQESHPRFGEPWQRLGYEPMRELITLLRANGFRTVIVTTGHADFARAGAEAVFGLGPEAVLGSAVVTTLRDEGDVPTVRRLGDFAQRLDGTAKPLAIDRVLAVRPLIAVGNVRDGSDIGVLRFSHAGRDRPGLQLVIVHDDFEREYAYTEPDRATLTAADAAGWVAVSMRYDWTRLFPFQALPAAAASPP